MASGDFINEGIKEKPTKQGLIEQRPKKQPLRESRGGSLDSPDVSIASSGTDKSVSHTARAISGSGRRSCRNDPRNNEQVDQTPDMSTTVPKLSSCIDVSSDCCGCLGCHEPAVVVINHPTHGRRVVCDGHADGFVVIEVLEVQHD